MDKIYKIRVSALWFENIVEEHETFLSKKAKFKIVLKMSEVFLHGNRRFCDSQECRGMALDIHLLCFLRLVIFMFLFSILFSKLKIYKDGISFRMYHAYFDEIGRIQLKWNGRLLVFGKLNWYLVLNSEEFIRAIKNLQTRNLSGIQEAC